MHPEIVEAHSTLANIMALLQQCKLASRPFPASTAAGASSAAANAAGEQQRGSAGGAAARSSSTYSSAVSARSSAADTISGVAGSGSAILPSCVVVKRQDGSCCSRVCVTESCSIAELQATIQQVEVRRAGHLAAAGAAGCAAVAMVVVLLCIEVSMHNG
jgi:hypothetical protein